MAQNESAVTEMGTSVLANIARDLVRTLRRDVTTDWASRDDVRAKIRSTIKRLLAKYGYPPDAQAGATELVLRQMETFAEEWSPQSGYSPAGTSPASHASSDREIREGAPGDPLGQVGQARRESCRRRPVKAREHLGLKAKGGARPLCVGRAQLVWPVG